jgi:hypothetical protein
LSGNRTKIYMEILTDKNDGGFVFFIAGTMLMGEFVQG